MKKKRRRTRIEDEHDLDRGLTENDPASVEEIEQLRERLEIDKDDLDRELVEQPDLVYRAHWGKALATSERDHQKEHLKQIEKSVAARARLNHQREHEKAPTQDDLKRAIEADTEWKEQKQTYLELCLKVDLWSALTTGYSSRGVMLHDLCELEISQSKAIGGQSPRGDR